MTTQTRPRANVVPAPERDTPGGAQTPRPTDVTPTPTDGSSGGDPTSRQANSDPMPTAATPAGADSHPTNDDAMPMWDASGGAQLAGRHPFADARGERATSDLPTGRHGMPDAHIVHAAGSNAEQDPVANKGAATGHSSLLDPALALAADVLDDLERVRIANANRLRILTTSEADSDGETRGFGLDESHPDVARLAAIVDMLGKVEKDATSNLQRQMRRHPLHPWAKSIRGVGDKQVARLLAAIGDPYIRPEIEREDGTVVSSGPRTVSALWAYCGLHVLPASGQAKHGGHTPLAAGRDQLPADQIGFDTRAQHVGGLGGDPGPTGAATHKRSAGVAPRRARGQKVNWSTKGKTRAHLIATSCLKQLVKPCTGDAHVDDCQCSPYRVVYDGRRKHTAVTHPDWTDGHSHNDALRISAKAFLRDLWREAKRIHELNAEEAS